MALEVPVAFARAIEEARSEDRRRWWSFAFAILLAILVATALVVRVSSAAFVDTTATPANSSRRERSIWSTTTPERRCSTCPV